MGAPCGKQKQQNKKADSLAMEAKIHNAPLNTNIQEDQILLSLNGQRQQYEPVQPNQRQDFNILVLEWEEQEMRPKKHTKIDEAINSIDIARKKQDQEFPSNHHLKYSIALEKQSRLNLQIQDNPLIQSGQIGLERITIELRDSALEQKSIFRQRLITTQQQRKSSKSIAKLQLANSCSLDRLRQQSLKTPTLSYSTEEDPQTIPVHLHRIVQSKLQSNHKSLITIQNNQDEGKKLLYKAINDQIESEQNMQGFQNIQRTSQERFLQNVQLADKYLNEEGFFYVLKEALKSKGIILLLVDDKFQQKKVYQITKGQQLNKSIQSYFNAQIKLTDICLLADGFSQLQFELCFKDSPTHSYLTLSNDFNINKSFTSDVKNIIFQTLQDLQIPINEIICLRLKNNPLQTFSLFVTIPLFKDHKKDIFKDKLIQELNKQQNFLALQIQPLYKYFEASQEMLDPWRNIEFKLENSDDLRKRLLKNSDIPQGWKLFAFKQSNFGTIIEECIENTGYINLFSLRDTDRQDNQDLKLPSQYIPIVKSFTLFKQNSDFKFLQPRSIEVKVYGEIKNYQVILRVVYCKNKTIQLKTGNQILDSGIIVVDSASSIKLIGILVMDDDKSARVTTAQSVFL